MQRFERFLRTLDSGPLGAYLNFLGLLLLIAGGFFVYMSITGCGCGGDGGSGNNQQPADPPAVEAYIEVRQSWALPNGRVWRMVGTTLLEPPGPSSLILSWYGPVGSTNYTFSRTPDNPDGPPPFRFSGLAPGEYVIIEFNMPGPPTGRQCWQERQSCPVTDAAQAEWGQSSKSAANYVTDLRASAPPAGLSPAVERPAPRTPTTVPQQVLAWQVDSVIVPQGTTMTTALCQQWIDFMRDDGVFVALRTPISTTAITRSQPLPVLFGGPYSNTLQLNDVEGVGPVLTGVLAYRPHQFDFAATELPQEQGHAWFAIGLSTEPLTCPPGLEIPPFGWDLESRILLDLSDQPGNCVGCVLPGYTCYQGQAPPPFGGGLLSHLVGLSSAVTTYDDWGITCVGPHFVTLEPDPAWQLSGMGYRALTPSEVPTPTLAFRHALISDQLRDIDLTFSSTLGVDWGLYGGTLAEPDLADPIALPVSVVGYKVIWLVSTPVPTDTASGPYTVVLTATALTNPTPPSWTTSDLIWIGGWSPPPQPSCDEIAAVALSGPAEGDPGASLAFLAVTTPPTATTPLTYTWEADDQAPVLHPLRGYTDTLSYSWPGAGSYWITVTAVNRCGVSAGASRRVAIGMPRSIYLPVVFKSY